eukprot:1698871-Prymnesium_polylepis.1
MLWEPAGSGNEQRGRKPRLDLLCVLALTASRAALSLFEELLVHKSVGQERELSHPSVWDQPAVPVDPPSSQRQLVDLNVFALPHIRAVHVRAGRSIARS